MVDVLPKMSPQLVEIAAIREGLKIAVRLGLSRVIIETDSLSSIALIREGSLVQNEISNWLAIFVCYHKISR